MSVYLSELRYHRFKLWTFACPTQSGKDRLIVRLSSRDRHLATSPLPASRFPANLQNHGAFATGTCRHHERPKAR